jgi:hypothetical protein
MKTNIGCTLLFVSVLFASLGVVTHSVKAGSTSSSPVVTILYPTNETYNSRILNLNVTFVFGRGMQYTLKYSSDGRKPEISIPWTIGNPEELHVIYKATGSATLLALDEGMHSLTVNLVSEGFVTGSNPRAYSDTVWFTIDLTPPNISDVSVDNKTYTTTDVPLNFTVNENISKSTYSINGEHNVTISGNTTLKGLPIGIHNVTVYVWDTAGNIGASQTVNFTVANEASTALVVTASAASVAAVAAGVAVYFKKLRK